VINPGEPERRKSPDPTCDVVLDVARGNRRTDVLPLACVCDQPRRAERREPDPTCDVVLDVARGNRRTDVLPLAGAHVVAPLIGWYLQDKWLFGDDSCIDGRLVAIESDFETFDLH